MKRFLPFLLLSSLSVSIYAYDSVAIQPVNVVVKKYKAYVDTGNCIITNKKLFIVIGGGGGGDLSQQCPASHPVMYSWNHNVVYSTAVPWLGSVMGGGGASSVKCCAIGYQWG